MIIFKEACQGKYTQVFFVVVLILKSEVNSLMLNESLLHLRKGGDGWDLQKAVVPINK